METETVKHLTQIEFDYCYKYINKLLRHPLSACFLIPVDPVRDRVPDYPKIITHPMDLGTVRDNLLDGKYSTSEEWKNDINLVWSNAKLYNKSGNPIHECATFLEQKVKKDLEMIPKTEYDEWQLKIIKINNKIEKLLVNISKEDNKLPMSDSLLISPP